MNQPTVEELDVTPTTTETYDQLLDLLTGYLSRIMAHSIIDRALAQCRLSPDLFAPESVSPVVEQARIGLGIFCDPDRLSSLMLDLATFCERHGGARGAPVEPAESAEPASSKRPERKAESERFVKNYKRCPTPQPARVYRPLSISPESQGSCVGR